MLEDNSENEANLNGFILFVFFIPINTNPTGFLKDPPSGPAIPVIDIDIFVGWTLWLDPLIGRLAFAFQIRHFAP